MSSRKDNRTPRELVQQLRQAGLSVAEIAGELQRDPRMVRKVLNGEVTGEQYRRTLQELADTGKATNRPERQRAGDGRLIPVRAPAGSPTKSVTPVDTGGRYSSKKQGGRFTSSTYLGGGGRQHEIGIPKGKTTKGREQGARDLLEKVRAAARNQAHKQQRLKFQLTFSNGRVMEVKDYNASTFLQRVRGADPINWLTDQARDREGYDSLDVSRSTITGVTMTVYAAPKTDQYLRATQRRGNR